MSAKHIIDLHRDGFVVSRLQPRKRRQCWMFSLIQPAQQGKAERWTYL